MSKTVYIEVSATVKLVVPVEEPRLDPGVKWSESEIKHSMLDDGEQEARRRLAEICSDTVIDEVRVY